MNARLLLSLLIGVALVGGAGLVFWSSPAGEDDTAVPVPADVSDRDVEVSPLRTSPLVDPQGPEETSRSVPIPLAVTDPRLPFRERVGAAVHHLAGALRDEPYDRASWETRIAAVAGSLGEDAIEELFTLADDASASELHLLAAAELLRPLQIEARQPLGSLPAPTLAALRRAVGDGEVDPAVRETAARSLAALGQENDRLALLERLTSDDDPTERARAGWALRAAVDPRTAVYLSEELDPHDEATTLRLTTLYDWARANPIDGPDLDREVAARNVAAVLTDSGAPEAIRFRALEASRALGGDRLGATLGQVLDGEACPPRLLNRALHALAPLRDPDSITRRERILHDPDALPAMRLALAEGLLRHPDADAGERETAREILRRVVDESEDYDARLRAVNALSPPPKHLTPIE